MCSQWLILTCEVFLYFVLPYPFFIVVSVKLNGSLIFDCVKNLVNVYIAQCKMVEFNYLESKRCLREGGGQPETS